jgi:hypothetical protein
MTNPGTNLRTTPGTTPWSISAGAERMELDQTGKAETTFTVTNNGPVDQRVVFDVVPGDGADRAWFSVTEPQVLVPHGRSVTFVAKVAVPPGTPAGSRWLSGRAYSADVAPEESSVVSDRVAFEVRPTEAPVPWWRKWWWLIAVAALVVVVLAVVLFLVLGGDDPPAQDTTGETTAPPAPTVVRQAQATTLRVSVSVDLDEIAFQVGEDNESDLVYAPRGQSDGLITPLNGTRLAKIGATDQPAAACAGAALSGSRVQVSSWQRDEVLCVRTNAGRLSVIVLNQKVSLLIQPPPPPQLQVSITTFDR